MSKAPTAPGRSSKIKDTYTPKTGGFRSGRWLPPNGGHWSGYCADGAASDELNNRQRGSSGHHKHCRGAFPRTPAEVKAIREKEMAKLKLSAKQAEERLLPPVDVPKRLEDISVDPIRRCACSCHTGEEEPRNMEREIADARAARALASGRSAVTVNPITGKRTKEKCKHGHDMTPENTGPGNVCRACKRDASNRTKAKKAALAAKQAEGKP